MNRSTAVSYKRGKAPSGVSSNRRNTGQK